MGYPNIYAKIKYPDDYVFESKKFSPKFATEIPENLTKD
jgi:hypothetical protein